VRTFPGLWIHGDALFADDYGRALATLEQGLAMPQHAEFVKKLAAAGQQKSATRSSSRPAKRKPQ
jgi:hypothetical protein